MIPDALKAKIKEVHAQRPAVVSGLPSNSPGELVVAESRGGSVRRIVVITRLDDAGVCRVQLMTNDVDMATDLDMSVGFDDSGFPTQLLAQPELSGPVFKNQLVELVGRIDQTLTDALADALRTDGESIPRDRGGLPLGDSADPRRRFKEDELDDLNDLVRDCRNWLMGAPADCRVLDPQAFLPPPTGASHEEMFTAYDELLETLRTVESGEVTLPDLESLFDEAAFVEIGRWQSMFNFNFWDWWTLHSSRSGTQRTWEPSEPANVDGLRQAVLASEAIGQPNTVDFVSRQSLAGNTEAHPTIATRIVEVNMEVAA